MRYVVANFGQQSATTMQVARSIAVNINSVDRRGTISATAIPVAAISARLTNG